MAISINYLGDKYDEKLTYITDAITSFGVTTDEMADTVKKLAFLMQSMADTNVRIDLIEQKLNQLRPATDEKTEIPKQKSDLEIFSQIEPSTEFLILGDVGWSDDIIDMDKTNMFLN